MSRSCPGRRRHFNCVGRAAGLSMPAQSKKRRGSEARLPTWHIGRESMSPRLGRRTFTQRAGAIAVAATLPMPAIAQDKPVKIGLLTVKTGPLAQGGLQMEQGINLFLKHRS